MRLWTPYISTVISFLIFVFFFKQKTAYEMRISDWNSDVCSSDLPSRTTHPRNLPTERDPAMHTHPRLVQITALALGIAGAMAFSKAHAAAFLLTENSVKAQGRSTVDAASYKGDASALAATPPGLARKGFVWGQSG